MGILDFAQRYSFRRPQLVDFNHDLIGKGDRSSRLQGLCGGG